MATIAWQLLTNDQYDAMVKAVSDHWRDEFRPFVLKDERWLAQEKKRKARKAKRR